MLNSVQYQHIDDQGLHIVRNGQGQLLEVDNIIVCAGQESDRSLYDQLNESAAVRENNININLIGGAYKASELDAKAAINQACYLAAEV